jgi:hypothetical protein
MPADRAAFAPACATGVRRPGAPPLGTDLGRCSPPLSPAGLAPAGVWGPCLPRLAPAAAGLQTAVSLPRLAGSSGGLGHARLLLPGLHTCRTCLAGLSRIAACSCRREAGLCAPRLPYQPWPSGRGKQPLASPLLPPIRCTRGPHGDGACVRSRSGPPGGAPPGLRRPSRGSACLRLRQPGFQSSSPPEACRIGLRRHMGHGADRTGTCKYHRESRCAPSRGALGQRCPTFPTRSAQLPACGTLLRYDCQEPIAGAFGAPAPSPMPWVAPLVWGPWLAQGAWARRPPPRPAGSLHRAGRHS